MRYTHTGKKLKIQRYGKEIMGGKKTKRMRGNGGGGNVFELNLGCVDLWQALLKGDGHSTR